MSENLSPHNEPWDDMPLPNEEEAWQKMKRLLDKEDKRRRFLPFWFWRYGVLGFLLLGTAAGSYFLLTQNGKQPVAGAANEETDQQQRSEPTSLQNKREKDPSPTAPAAEKKEEKAGKESGVSLTPVQETTVTAAKKKKEILAYKTPVRKPESKRPAKLSGVQPATAVRRKKPVAQPDRFPKQKQTEIINNVQSGVPATGKEKNAITVAKN